MERLLKLMQAVGAVVDTAIVMGGDYYQTFQIVILSNPPHPKQLLDAAGDAFGDDVSGVCIYVMENGQHAAEIYFKQTADLQ